jgi:DNA-binding IclR family transcriptional regulator
MKHATPQQRVNKRVTDTITLVRDQTDNLWRMRGRAPTLREVAEACGKSTSQIHSAWRSLEKQGVLKFEDRGNFRKLVAMDGMLSERERTVRELAAQGMLAVSLDVALDAVTFVQGDNTVAAQNA